MPTRQMLVVVTIPPLTHERNLYVGSVPVAALVEADAVAVRALIQQVIGHLVTVNTRHTQVVCHRWRLTGRHTAWLHVVTQRKRHVCGDK